MQISQWIGCQDFPCADIQREGYMLPNIDIHPEKIAVIMLSEATPAKPQDYYYAEHGALFQQTTVQAFQDAGVRVASITDILESGVYLTTAVKCSKTGYGIKANTIKTCSFILEKELALFSNVKVFMLMGDVAIKALNYIGTRIGEGKVIPSGATYKIRGEQYSFQGKRVFPSYLQVGPSFFIEKSKRRMIAEDISKAMELIK